MGFMERVGEHFAPDDAVMEELGRYGWRDATDTGDAMA